MHHSRHISKQIALCARPMIVSGAQGTLVLIGPKALWRKMRPGSLERVSAV